MQSWIRNSNPRPDRNFNLAVTPTSAGDVNGDGVNDYLYATPNARDERTTSNRADVTGKTALFFGGTPEPAEDQLLYVELHPVGDLNQDGKDDAVQFSNGTVRIYEGTTSGYQDTGVTRSLNLNADIFRGFADFDEDGIEDALLGSSQADAFAVIYGASSFSSVTLKTYTPQQSGELFSYTVANLDGDDRPQFVRLASLAGSDDIEIQAFNPDPSTRTFNVFQTFVPEEIAGDARVFRTTSVNVNGTKGNELVVAFNAFEDESTPGGFTLVFPLGPRAEEYNPTPNVLSDSYSAPVGDLNGDGRHDFVTFNGQTEERYISFGPSDLSTQLTFDTKIPQSGNDLPNRAVNFYLRRGTLGDVTGNGTVDAVLGYASYDRSSSTPATVGRRFFEVNTDGTARTPTDVTYPRENFFDAVNETNEIGDFNDDGTTDFAIVRSDLGRVEIFYGGSSISQTPDLTLTPPNNDYATSVSSGDFNGDGVSDLVVGHSTEPSVDETDQIDVYLGGQSPDGTSDRTITTGDVGFPPQLPRAIGDVNNDGQTDWMVSDRGFNSGVAASGQNVAIFFGDDPLPTSASQTLNYGDGQFLGEVSVALGDVNGDGIDDFAYINSVSNQVDVFFGSNSPSFSTTPDLGLSSPTFYNGLAAGDFNGDGESDIAVLPFNQGEIRIYYGGTNLDATPDQTLVIPTAVGGGDTDGDGLADTSIGPLESAGDVDNDGADELVHGSSFLGFSTNAVLYDPTTGNRPLRVFRAPNPAAGLGSQQFIYSTALGDFTGNGTVDFVATQFGDDNDAASSGRVYRFPIDLRTAATTKSVPGGESQQTFSGTGTSIAFSAGTSTSGSGSVTVERYDGSPASPDDIPSDQNLSTYRVVIEATNVDVGSGTEVRFDVSTLDGVNDPTAVDVYTRPTTGSGSFTKQTTTVDDQGTTDPSDDELVVTVSSFSEFAFASSTQPLPVELAGFDAQLDGESVRLHWTTTSESGNAGFRIQRQAGAGEWTTVGRVDGAESTTGTQSYTFTDAQLPYEADRLTYRLKQVDADGSTHLLETARVSRRVQDVQLLGTYPNPASQQVTLRYAVPERQDVTVRLYDVLGRRVRTVVDAPKSGRHKQTVDVTGLSSGVYFLRLTAGNATRTQRVTVVR